MKPVIYLANWSGRAMHGPGRKLGIMRRPRRWEHGDGEVAALKPPAVAFNLWKSGRLAPEDYARECRAAFAVAVERGTLEPGRLWVENAFGDGGPVMPGDTLLCGCARAAAAHGECHRVWAASSLLQAGWAVHIDFHSTPLDRALYDDVVQGDPKRGWTVQPGPRIVHPMSEGANR